MPEWLPRDLPLPPGTYASHDYGKREGYFSGLFVVPRGATPFARFALREWPKRGWELGRGEAEQGEVEDDFRKGTAEGAFKVNDQACKPPFGLLLLFYSPGDGEGSPTS